MAWILPFVLLGSCDKELVEYEKGSVEIVVERGDAWLHDFPLFLGIKRKNPPQIAVWIEDAQGRYLSTVYASSKIATQSWLAAGGNRRREALPHWCHSRGVQYADGLYLPTKSEPLADGISGATPRGSFDLKLSPEAVDLSDGQFELMLVPVPKTPLQLQRTIRAIVYEEYETSNALIFRHVRHVTAESDGSIPWTLDGEYAPGVPKIEIGIEDNGIQMMI